MKKNKFKVGPMSPSGCTITANETLLELLNKYTTLISIVIGFTIHALIIVKDTTNTKWQAYKSTL